MLIFSLYTKYIFYYIENQKELKNFLTTMAEALYIVNIEKLKASDNFGVTFDM